MFFMHNSKLDRKVSETRSKSDSAEKMSAKSQNMSSGDGLGAEIRTKIKEKYPKPKNQKKIRAAPGGAASALGGASRAVNLLFACCSLAVHLQFTCC